jgi:hypothetical protein
MNVVHDGHHLPDSSVPGSSVRGPGQSDPAMARPQPRRDRSATNAITPAAPAFVIALSVLRNAHPDPLCADTMCRRARSAELADLEQMAVWIAKEAADLVATLVGRR